MAFPRAASLLLQLKFRELPHATAPNHLEDEKAADMFAQLRLIGEIQDARDGDGPLPQQLPEPPSPEATK